MQLSDFAPDGLCAQTDPEIFFPDRSYHAPQAKKVCSGCEARLACLLWALEQDEDPEGIWGGTDERERREMRAA